MKKTDVRVKRTYKLLSDALARLLQSKSFEDLTVLEICEEADVHRATFYKHFVDKYDFLNTCIKIKLEDLSFEKIESSNSPEMMRKSIRRMFSNVLLFVEHNKDFFSAVSSDKYSASLNDTLCGAISSFIEERLRMRKDIEKSIGPQIPMIANYYAGAIVGLIKWWAKEENSCSVHEFMSFTQAKINEFCYYFNARS